MRVISLDEEASWIAEAESDRDIDHELPLQPFFIRSLQRIRLASTDDFKKHPVLCAGFYDSHMHPSWIAKQEVQLDCRQRSADEIVDQILALPQAQVRGYGWEESFLKCTLEEFEKLLERIPKEIILFRVCGHLAFLSGRGLLKDDQLGEIPDVSLTRNALLDVVNKVRSKGIDDFADLLVSPHEVSLLSEVAPDCLLFVDAKQIQSEADRPSLYAKYFLDGSLGARSAWLSRRYEDYDSKGLQQWTDQELMNSALKNLDAGYLLAFHAIGDAALDQLLSLAEKISPRLRSTTQGNLKHRIEHLHVCRDDQIEKLQTQDFWSLGLQPSHRVADEAFSLSRLGESRLRNEAYRLKSFLDAGLRVSLGSDAPVVSYDPVLTFEAIKSDTRVTERISLPQCYRLYCQEGRQNAGKSAKKVQESSPAWLSTFAC